MSPTEKKNPLGPTGETVRENIKAHRERLRLGYTELSRRLQDLGRPIPTLGLSRIEKGERRVDSDDLMALAAALEVSPITLLMPNDQNSSAETRVVATGFPHRATAEELWHWLQAEEPISPPQRSGAETTDHPGGTARDDGFVARVKFRAIAMPYWKYVDIVQNLTPRQVASIDFQTGMIRYVDDDTEEGQG